MTTREARQDALLEKTRNSHLSANELMSAIVYCGTDSTLKALCDVLEIENRVNELKKSA